MATSPPPWQRSRRAPARRRWRSPPGAAPAPLWRRSAAADSAWSGSLAKEWVCVIIIYIYILCIFIFIFIFIFIYIYLYLFIYIYIFIFIFILICDRWWYVYIILYMYDIYNYVMIEKNVNHRNDCNDSEIAIRYQYIYICDIWYIYMWYMIYDTWYMIYWYMIYHIV